ncbi:MAG: hypothetical protein BGO98_32770 [Myxococcales bacterium 68-20]|nr:hypothetical protein [Myxococcales bacterium]OJY18508.1 MAG: hypothetical protein BGO98_32770 [Myxococcales bacterium 68-20]
MLRHTAIVTIAVMAISIPLWSGGCSHRDPLNYPPPVEVGPPSFTSLDAAVVEEDAGLTSYCPSNKCPSGHTTCPISRFPCDVNLKADRDNCGACGFACPSSGDLYECIDGHCVLQCDISYNRDCDGFDDNGCETRLGTNDNCTGCGDKCLDPANPCVQRSSAPGDYGCGCGAGRLYCNGKCVDPKGDDQNCGGCGNVCDPSGDGGASRPNTYFGCIDGECGRYKCKDGHIDCDGDRLNGCEADLLSREHCGGCGNACAPGQECQLDLDSVPQCMCPAGQTFCAFFCAGAHCIGECADISSDPLNCGACGVLCGGTAETKLNECRYGVCTQVCGKGQADCNGNPADGCEVNVDQDPLNCGACGKVCDAVSGQACVGGQCVVEPCDEVQDAGELAR